jgi:tRNA pseudouridine38-40 synthase
MPRYKLTLEYDGSGYSGWQKQSGQTGVQEAMEDAVERFCGERTEVVGAGRTDAGVHATAQVAHVDLPRAYDPFRVQNGINFYLFDPSGKAEPDAEDVPPVNRIAVLNVEEVSQEFHARFSATKRHYRYHIINRRPRLAIEAGRAWRVIDPLDTNAMREAAKHLLGTHDFSSFRDTKCQAKSPIKTLERLEIVQNDENIFVEVSARSFLHHQVRIMVGTLSLVGRGKWKADDVKRALEAKDRTKGGLTAPADGLYLVGVDY